MTSPPRWTTAGTYDVYAHRKYNEVASDTWGHLFPKEGDHPGTILFTWTEWGHIEPISCDFGEDVPSSPWFHDALVQFIGRGKRKAGIYQFTGVCRARKGRIYFIGRVHTMNAVRARRGT